MSKKYDNNLKEIKETRTIATNYTPTIDYGFVCDVCGRKVLGTRIVNGMSFCVKCYQETFVNNELANLQQQLAEKDKEIKELKDTSLIEALRFRNKELERQFNDCKKEYDYVCDQLKDQRRQICEKIKEVFDEHRKILHSNYDECIFSMDEIIEELEELDRIEKGE